MKNLFLMLEQTIEDFAKEIKKVEDNIAELYTKFILYNLAEKSEIFQNSDLSKQDCAYTPYRK